MNTRPIAVLDTLVGNIVRDYDQSSSGFMWKDFIKYVLLLAAKIVYKWDGNKVLATLRSES